MDNNSIENNNTAKDNETDLQKWVKEMQANCDKYSKKFGPYGSGGYE